MMTASMVLGSMPAAAMLAASRATPFYPGSKMPRLSAVAHETERADAAVRV
jgi:hypothetical protein